MGVKERREKMEEGIQECKGGKGRLGVLGRDDGKAARERREGERRSDSSYSSYCGRKENLVAGVCAGRRLVAGRCVDFGGSARD